MTTDSRRANEFGIASFAMALAIAGSALLVCYFALRATSSGALLVASETERIESTDMARVEPLDLESSSYQRELSKPTERAEQIVLRGRIEREPSITTSECSIVIEHGAIDPRDRYEWELGVAEGTETHPLDALYSFVPHERALIEPSGSFEIKIARADRYRVLVHDGDGVASRRVSFADAKLDPKQNSRRTIDLGEVVLESISRLAIEFAGGMESELLALGPFRVELNRIAPTSLGNEWSWMLSHLDEGSAEAILHGKSMPLPTSGLRLPVLPDESLRVRLISNTSMRSRDYDVTIMRGETHRLVIPLDEAFSSDGLARYALRLISKGSGLSIAGALVQSNDGVSVRTDSEGRCEWLAQHANPRMVTIAEFDPDLPDRREYVEITAPASNGEQTIALEPTRWLRITGIGPPPEIRGEQPQSYRLEMRRPGGEWTAISLDIAKLEGDVLSVSVTQGEAEYRVVALWSAICAHESEPTVMLATDREAFTSFRIPSESPLFVRGKLIGTNGSPLTGIAIEATAPGCGGIPPVLEISDRTGSFTLGPIRARRIELVAHLPTGDIVREIDPAQGDVVSIDLRAIPSGGG